MPPCPSWPCDRPKFCGPEQREELGKSFGVICARVNRPGLGVIFNGLRSCPPLQVAGLGGSVCRSRSLVQGNASGGCALPPRGSSHALVPWRIVYLDIVEPTSRSVPVQLDMIQVSMILSILFKPLAEVNRHTYSQLHHLNQVFEPPNRLPPREFSIRQSRRCWPVPLGDVASV